MKQKKSTRSNIKASSKNYFNPYESVTSLNHSRTVSRDTYQKTKQASSLRNLDRKVNENQKKSMVQSTPKKIASSSKKNSTRKSEKKYQTLSKSESISKNSSQKASYSKDNTHLKVKKRKKMTKTQRMRLKRRRQLQMTLRIGIVMCLTIGLIWGGLAFKEFLTKPTISHQSVKLGSLDTSISFEGVIFRNEKIISSQEEGYAEYIVAEGEKVEKDATVYVLVDEENLATTTTAKSEVDSQIYNEAANQEATSNNQDKRYNLDQEVKSSFEEFYTNRYDSSTSNIYTLRSKLDSSVTNRTDLYTTEQEVTNQELIALKQDIESNIERYQKGKVVEESGLVSYYMDGYETEDAKVAIEALDYKNYCNYRKANSTTSLAPNVLKKEDAIYKLVTNNEWYVVTYIDADEDQWTKGQRYELNFDDLNNQKVQFTLISKLEEENRVKLVFKSTNQIGSFLGPRKVNFSIGNKETTGLKIPLESIVELNLIQIPKEYVTSDDSGLSVQRKKGENVEVVPIEIQNKEEELYYVIQDLTNALAIQLKDTLIHPKTGKTYDVTKSEVTQGVYVINGQIADFKEIEILAENQEYVLVKYNAKSQLKEMDKIISNPKSIKKDQLLDDMKIQNE